MTSFLQHKCHLVTLTYFLCSVEHSQVYAYPLRLAQRLKTYFPGGGRVVRWCWVNFQCQGVLLIWIIVGQGPTALAVGAGGGCLDIFSLAYHFSFSFSLSLGDGPI